MVFAMNNEPVAWMETYKGEPNNLDWDKNNLYCEGEFHNVVPLYTHSSDRIAELEKQIENLRWEVNHREQDIDHLKTRLADAKWKYDTNAHEYKYSAKFVQELEAKIAELAGANPLYTHPVKELTDEEIEQVMLEAGYGEVHKFVNPFDFARAILRKAQEK